MDKKEEREAWDVYAAEVLGILVRVKGQQKDPGWKHPEKVLAGGAGIFADAMLEERRKRFGDN